MTESEILEALPYGKPFRFVDGLSQYDDMGIHGHYTFPEDSDFYKGHFKDRPITPGVILTECCAQIGLVSLGIYLLNKENREIEGLLIAMSSAEMEFLLPVLPNEKIMVSSEKIYFRFHKLKCKVKMYNSRGNLACRGVLSGMLKINGDA